MCGVAGVFAYDDAAPPVDREELLRIRESMRSRGPDGAGLWISADERTGLAHRRLAIIDLSDAGAQPMATADGSLRVTFNGEIYNHRELKTELESKGYRFHSNSDTEVLLHLYADRGEEMVHALRGMYAFAIWDERKKELFLARDPFGIKPLYYADNGETLRFASQVKSLLKGGAVDAAREPAGSVGFLVWGSVPEPYTLYKGIRSLPAGVSMRVRRAGNASSTRFFNVGDEFRRAEQATSAKVVTASEILKEAVTDSVRNHLVADVPVGLFLSGGIDSTTLAALAASQSGAALHAVTLGFPEFKGTSNDEVPLAAKVAEQFGIHHQAHWITQEDFESELAQIVEAMDQPTIDGVNTYFVSRAAARSGMKVALSGLGGDELFGGYPSYSQVPQVVKWLGLGRRFPFAGRVVRRGLATFLGSLTSPKYAGALEYGSTYAGAYLLRRALFMPWEAESVLDRATVKAGLETLGILESLEATVHGIREVRSRVSALELSWYMRNQLLRDADWAGMAHSLEIRVPLVDVQLFRTLAPLIVSQHYPTKRDLAGVLPTPVPEKLISRRKTGFGTPVQQWIAKSSGHKQCERGLRSWAKRILPPQPRVFRALALVTDAFGGTGGIAKFNRDLLESIASVSECEEVVAIPRMISARVGPIPPRIKFVASAAGSKMRFVWTALSEVLLGSVDILIVGHINLAPLGAFLGFLRKMPSILVIHGIDAWSPHRNILTKPALSRFTVIASVSQLTLNRFAGWTGLDLATFRLLPNCVELQTYGPGPKLEQLADRLGLRDRTVIMTLGRLASEERSKGFDEIIEALPALARQVPNISYLICGEGGDRERLERKVEALGLTDRVVFTGFVPEEQKAHYYRLADAYVMPSRGEGFGIVLLEALACGLPVMGSILDGGREALLNGALGRLVDPSNQADVVQRVLETLDQGRGSVQSGLNYYSRLAFTQRAEAIVREALASPS
ncbi:MAG: asparagine synthase (glutamine-hydrolyzing) [Acidobacteriota bacterium]